MRPLKFALAFTAILAVSAPSLAQDKSTPLASTTSTENSGLFKYLLPIFKEKTGIDVKVVALGTGQALDVGRRGDAYVVFVQAKPLEEKFVAEGNGVARYEVMYNDFVVIGPKSDPAKIAGSKDAVAAFKKIADAKAPSPSRADTLVNHVKDMHLSQAAPTQ